MKPFYKLLGTQSFPLLVLVFVTAIVFAAAVMESAQSSPSFEVVSVRRCAPNEPVEGLRPAPGGQRYIAKCLPVRPIIWTSFWLPPDRVIGGPSWVDEDNYYIEGVASRPSSIAELHLMMRQALVERFNLKFHHEAKQLDAYILSVDKNGTKNIREHAPANGADFVIEHKQEKFHENWIARSSPMEFFVWQLSMNVRRPIVDKTGLRAPGYDFEISFTRELPPGTDLAALGFTPFDLSGPTIFQALPSQVGLRLDDERTAVDVLVIDAIDRPSEN